MLGSIGTMMARESLGTIRLQRRRLPPRPRKRRHHPLVASLPLRTRFYASGLYISPLAPLLLGFGTVGYAMRRRATLRVAQAV